DWFRGLGVLRLARHPAPRPSADHCRPSGRRLPGAGRLPDVFRDGPLLLWCDRGRPSARPGAAFGAAGADRPSRGLPGLVPDLWGLGRGIAALAGVVLQFAITGLVRAQLGDAQAASPRYVYVAAALLLPVAADLMAGVRWQGGLGWLLLAGFALAFLNGAVHLDSFARDRIALIALQNGELQTLMAFRGAPDMNLNQEIDQAVIPKITPGLYFAATDALGSPLPAVDVSGLRRLPAAAVNQAMVSAFAGALRIGQTSPPNDAATVSGTCRTYLGESTAYVDVTIPSRGTRRISASDGGLASLWLSYLSSPVGGPQRQVFLVPNVW